MVNVFYTFYSGSIFDKYIFLSKDYNRTKQFIEILNWCSYKFRKCIKIVFDEEVCNLDY